MSRRPWKAAYYPKMMLEDRRTRATLCLLYCLGPVIGETLALEKLMEQTFRSFESIYHVEFEKKRDRKCKGFKQPDSCSDRDLNPGRRLERPE